MSSIRRAFFFASAERYIVIAINFALVPIIARLMGPAEFGISVLGMAALAIAEVIRDFGGGAYIIQEKHLTIERIRTAFTITLAWTLVLAVTLFAAAEPLARFYEVPGLKLYLQIVAISYLIGPFVAPLFALMQREMAFDKIAIITIFSTLTNAAFTITLARLGYSYLSFALANVASATCGMLWASISGRNSRCSGSRLPSGARCSISGAIRWASACWPVYGATYLTSSLGVCSTTPQ